MDESLKKADVRKYHGWFTVGFRMYSGSIKDLARITKN